MSKISFNCGAYITALMCLLMLSACATTATPQRNQIDQRVQDRWDAMLRDDIVGAYEYLSPGYRSSVSSVQYMRLILNKQVQWTGARYIKSECSETICNVTISLDYAVHGAIPGVKTFNATQEIQESWIMVDGMWYLVPTA